MTDDELTEEVAGMLVRIESNYLRETSGPGSRFEGQRLEGRAGQSGYPAHSGTRRRDEGGCVMETYTHTDEEGDVLTINRAARQAGGRAREGARGGAEVTAAKLPEVTGKLYEACGLPVPVILERPAPREMLAAGPHGDEVVHVEPSPAATSSVEPPAAWCWNWEASQSG